MEKPIRIKKKLFLSGGSLAMIVPNEWIIEQNLTLGSEVIVEIYDKKIEITPVKK